MRQGCVNYPNNNNEDCPILPGPFPIIIGQTGPTGPTGTTGPMGEDCATGELLLNGGFEDVTDDQPNDWTFTNL